MAAAVGSSARWHIRHERWRIENNTANYDGGGVYLYNPGAVFTQTGGVVGGNLATPTGGGVHVFSGNAILKGGDIINNTASSNGGGVYGPHDQRRVHADDGGHRAQPGHGRRWAEASLWTWARPR